MKRRHPGWAPIVHPPFYTHVDDLCGWVWGATEEAALKGAQGVLDEVTVAVCAGGLDVHKFEVGMRR